MRAANPLFLLGSLALCLCLTAVVAGATAADETKRSRPPSSPPGKLVDVGGYRLHLYCTAAGGRGPAVVLISGSGDFSFDWSLVQPRVSRFARVCSYDRAGTAWSDPGPVPRTMRQDVHELHALLKAARIAGPYVLVGHSIGGLIARLYAERFPGEVAGVVLVDPTHEDTTLMYQGRLVRVRDGALGKPIPPVQSMQSSPPQPATAEDLAQFEFNRKMFGAPKTGPPYDKLPASVQVLRLRFRSKPPRVAAGPDYWAEELQAMYTMRVGNPKQLGGLPLVLVLPKLEAGDPPPGIAADEWKRVGEEKRRQKMGLTALSSNSKLIVAEGSGHHIQLDEPQTVTRAIRLVFDAARATSALNRRRING